MKNLIGITVLLVLMMTSGSFAQSNENLKSTLLAKTENNELSISKIANEHEKIRSNVEQNSTANSSDNQYSVKRNARHSVASDSKDDSRDISLLIKKELKSEKNLDLEYKSTKLKADHLPLVISSKNKKTRGIVFPPFLYLKKQF
jgi:hypothetical protein